MDVQMPSADSSEDGIAAAKLGAGSWPKPYG